MSSIERFIASSQSVVAGEDITFSLNYSGLDYQPGETVEVAAFGRNAFLDFSGKDIWKVVLDDQLKGSLTVTATRDADTEVESFIFRSYLTTNLGNTWEETEIEVQPNPPGPVAEVTDVQYDVKTGRVEITGTGFVSVDGDDVNGGYAYFENESGEYQYLPGGEITSGTSIVIDVSEDKRLAIAELFSGGSKEDYTLEIQTGFFNGSQQDLNITRDVSVTYAPPEDIAPPASGGGSPSPSPSPVNFTGSEGRDITNGGDLNDELRGFGGDDQLNGGGGDDFINGNVGNDYIIGAQGNDYLMGGSENDEVRGGSGNDFTNGNRGNDFVFGGDGNDTVRGGSEDDVIYGGAGNDSLYGDKGNDVLYGELGSDIFNLSTGNDIIQDFEVGVDSFNLNGVLNLSFTQTDDGALATYDGGSTLFSGVDSLALV